MGERLSISTHSILVEVMVRIRVIGPNEGQVEDWILLTCVFQQFCIRVIARFQTLTTPRRCKEGFPCAG